jgi:hypothetical protein
MNIVNIQSGSRKPNTYIGLNVLAAKVGTLLLVTSTWSNAGEILMRVDNDSRPLVTLRDGSLWGTSLESYEFEEILDSVTIN